MKPKNCFRVVVLLLVVAALLGFTSPVNPCYAQGGYGYGGGGGAGIPPPGLILLMGKISSTGVLTEGVTATSPDGLSQLTLDKGTTALNKWGRPLSGIVMVKMKAPPAPPENANFVGLVYDLGPEGTTFKPSPTLTITYDPDKIPAGVGEENLVLAMWEEASAGKWVVLKDCKVDPATHTISAPVSHFTAFTILAYTRPAAFTASNLSITPAEVDVGKSATISVVVTNAGDLRDSHKVILKIDNVVIDTKDVALAGGTSQKVTFTASKDAAGSYTVNVDGLSGTLVVKGVPPPPAPPPAPPPPAPPAPAPPVVPPAPPAPPINWWLIGGIIAAVIIIGVVIWWVFGRRQKA